ncbi:reticulon-like protein B17 [Juglans microcarpa x Juglans regia]|uniref:reticulon-like protein B17 n=1 Tax=Juglans microcarpa x Juglans regia TaxID=2249226 RepID=UPI001B7F64BA|nr:reticulon-like protein B17 [Juglans microcarpa x Juglans regia]
MDSTPSSHRSEPSRLRTKWASRLARIGDLNVETKEPPHLSLDLAPSPSPKKAATPSPSTLSLRTSNSIPLHELLLLSSSPLRKSKTRLADRLDMAEEQVEAAGSRRRCKSRTAQMGLLGCASPRNARRSRRRSEIEIREEKELGLMDEVGGKPRKKRHSVRSKKEKLSLVPSVPSSSLSPKTVDDDGGNLDRIGQLINDLITWRDIAKSSLWFGVGTLCFLSSCFTSGINFSVFSAISQLGLLFLGASFVSNSICQRNNDEKKHDFKLKEDDIFRLAKVILPATNLAISKTRELFSGEPSMTLKVAPLLVLGAEYGHLITLWRLCAIGFFLSFSVPKLYSCYSIQINQKVEWLKWWVAEVWGACSHKKIVAASAITAFWNLSTVKTRIFTAFISLVILRYCRQHIVHRMDQGKADTSEQVQQQQALVVIEGAGCPKQ